MQNLLSRAIEAHEAGQLAPAADLYRQVLDLDPDNANALHLLGVLHHQRGQHGRALELIGRAVALRPTVPAFHPNLAEVYRALGQFERAAGCCRMALRLRPNFPEALCNLGLALAGLDRHEEAIEQFQLALQIRSGSPAVRNNLGISLRQLQRFAEALEQFRQAVDLDSKYAPARTNLGQALLDNGQAEEALPHCQEAVRLQPDVAALHNNLGNAWRALGRLIEARVAYLEALRLDPNLAQAHAYLGRVLHREGEHEDALPWLKHAVELDSASTTYWEYLAELHADREELAEAIPCWQRVLALDNTRPGPHIALGWALQEEGRSDEAARQYQAALAIDPSAAWAQLNLGGLHEESGDLDQAEAAFREALRLQPNYALPHARLGMLKRDKLPEPDFALLEERLADPQLDDEARAHLLFALAQILDARGEFTRAADCSRQANSLALNNAIGRHRIYRAADHEHFVEGVLKVFSSDFLTRLATAGNGTCRPVFVFGLPRSGTTLVEQVLASHSQIRAVGERRFARQAFEAIPTLLGRSEAPLEAVAHLDGRVVRALAERHLEKLAQLDDGGAVRVVDKMPDNYMYLGLLAVMFPCATFIHCRRNLRDVAVSCWMTDFRSIRWANTPENLASRFQQYHRLMNHWRAVLPVQVHEVDYEATVADLETVARRLVAACGLEWDPACLEFHRTRRSVRTASVTQVRQPIYVQSVARWKNYQPQLSELFADLPDDGLSSSPLNNVH